MRLRPLLALLALTSGASGCIHSEVVVSAYQLQRQVPELRREGVAEVDGHRVTVDTEVEARSDALFSPTAIGTVGRLIEGCPDIAPLGRARERAEEDCRLLRADSVSLGEEVDWGKSIALWAGAALAVTIAGVLLGVLLSADAADSHCDLDCGP